jgi:hypothetical protein
MKCGAAKNEMIRKFVGVKGFMKAQAIPIDNPEPV